MNKSAIDRWTHELRSGNRAQGTGKLDFTHDGVRQQCCLGVACDLFTEELGLEVKEYEGWLHYNDENSVLPGAVKDYLGFDQRNPDIRLPLTFEQLDQAERDGKMTTESIAELNDAGFTFEQLADVIDYFFRD